MAKYLPRIGAMVAVSVLAPQLYAADADGRFAIRGAGLLNCQNFIEERAKESPAYIMIGGWIDGYITGINQHLGDTYDITSFESSELIAQVLQNHCEDNPDDRLFTVLNSLFTKVEEDRIRSAGAPVIVEVGERSTRLYRPTVVRIQAALAELGLYTDEPTGFYDTASAEAMREYQASLNFEPTGFPDQATLWHLLWGAGESVR